MTDKDITDDFEIIRYKTGVYELIDKTTGVMVLTRREKAIEFLEYVIREIKRRKK